MLELTYTRRVNYDPVHGHGLTEASTADLVVGNTTPAPGGWQSVEGSPRPISAFLYATWRIVAVSLIDSQGVERSQIAVLVHFRLLSEIEPQPQFVEEILDAGCAAVVSRVRYPA